MYKLTKFSVTVTVIADGEFMHDFLIINKASLR